MSLVAIVLFLSCIFSVSVVDAERFNIEMTLEAGEHFEIHKALTNGSRIVGSYSKTLSVSDFFFFICNSTNFLEWTAGNLHASSDALSIDRWSGSAYDFDVIVPYADTWYVVFSNEHSYMQAIVSGYVDFPDVLPYPLIGGGLVVVAVILIAIVLTRKPKPVALVDHYVVDN